MSRNALPVTLAVEHAITTWPHNACHVRMTMQPYKFPPEHVSAMIRTMTRTALTGLIVHYEPLSELLVMAGQMTIA